MNHFLIHTSYSTVQSVMWQMSYEILKFLLFISQDKMIRANKYFHNYIGKLWWYKCVLHGVCCCTRKKFIQVAKERQHFDLCNFRHFVPDWCIYCNQPKWTLFNLFWRCWQNWKGSTMITLTHLTYFDILFIRHFFNLKLWTNLQTLTYVMYMFFSNLYSCIFVMTKGKENMF